MKISRGFVLLTGVAAIGLSPLPAPFGLLHPVVAQAGTDDASGDDDDDDNDSDLIDTGAPDDQDGDLTDDDQTEVEPTAEVETSWSDKAANADERRAEAVDADDYLTKCRNKAECRATLKSVEQQLQQMLTNHAQRPPNHQRAVAQTRGKAGKAAKVTKYRVIEGQSLQRTSGQVGARDQQLWGQVTQTLPRAKIADYFGSFWIGHKRDTKEDLLAFVQGEDGSDKFLMNINEVNHLETDVREQYLTIVHEFTHMLDFRQAVGEQAYDQSSKGRVSTADLRSVTDALQSIFGSDKGEAIAPNNASQQQQDVAETPDVSCEGGVRDDDSCFPADSLYAKFTNRFWTKEDLEADRTSDPYIKRNAARFVTEYAMTNPHEDIAESFSYWVIAEGKGKTVADAKQRFFGRFPQLVALKDHIRRAVIADILRSQSGKTKS